VDYSKKKKQEATIETGEMKFLSSVAGYTRKDQINTNIWEELNFFNINAKVINPDHNGNIACNEWKIPRKVLTYNPKESKI
jgi:hypothetical protein